MIGVLNASIGPIPEGTSSASFRAVSRRVRAVFDEDNIVSCAGLVPVMTLAAQTTKR